MIEKMRFSAAVMFGHLTGAMITDPFLSPTESGTRSDAEAMKPSR